MFNVFLICSFPLNYNKNFLSVIQTTQNHFSPFVFRWFKYLLFMHRYSILTIWFFNPEPIHKLRKNVTKSTRNWWERKAVGPSNRTCFGKQRCINILKARIINKCVDCSDSKGKLCRNHLALSQWTFHSIQNVFRIVTLGDKMRV